jgi:hypothetical protein
MRDASDGHLAFLRLFVPMIPSKNLTLPEPEFWSSDFVVRSDRVHALLDRTVLSLA